MRAALAAVLAAAALAATAARAQAPEPGVVAGRVAVLEAAFFGGMRAKEDRGGVLVYLTGFRTPAPAQPAELRQRDETFEPRLLPVVAGQTVVFPNEDPVYHNVFSVSPLQPFDLGQYKASEPPRSQRFPQAGLVPVYCNIHPKMLAYVAVLENGAFALTDASGAFEIRGAPAGRVTVNAWAPGAQRVSRELELRAGERAEVELELRQSERIAPHKRKDGSEYPKPKPGRDYR